jgi:hypothetical protein
MLNTGLPGAISLAAQGLTDQTFHIIRLSIDAPWIQLWDLKGVGDGQEGVVPGGVGAIVGVCGGVCGVDAGAKLFALICVADPRQGVDP